MQTVDMANLPLKYQRKHWAEQQNLNYTQIATRLGVSVSRVSSIMSSGFAPPVHVRMLREEFGMPEELLPRPSSGRWPSSNAA